jgi:hypothetical protein
MEFKVKYLKVISSFNPIEGRSYVEPTMRKELDNMYNMIV